LDRLVARYYPSVYSFAARLTDDPGKAVALPREAFNRARKRAHLISGRNFKSPEMSSLKILRTG